MRMNRWCGKVAVVTGASSGIGAAVCKKLVKSGVVVAGLARRREKVEELARNLKELGGKLLAVKTDVTIEDQVIEAFEWIKDNVGPVHILVNCAGILRYTSLVDGNARLWKDVLDTNVFGLCLVTREACRSMRTNMVNGHIIHINSFTGHRVINYPDSNVYAASKCAVTALTETLRQELNHLDSRIKTTSVSPTGVATEMYQTALESSKVRRSTEDYVGLGPDDIADTVLYILSTPPQVQIYELMLHAVKEPF